MSINFQKLPDYYNKLPKVDLHRHLEGSLRVVTLVELARAYKISLPESPDLNSLVQVQPGEPFTMGNFLAKFPTLRLFYRSPEVISRLTGEAIEDAALDGVRYLELMFTPVALSRSQGFPMREVMDWVVEAAQKASTDFKIKVRLIASVNRHEAVQLAEEVAMLAADRISRGVVGLNLAGNEAEFPANIFAGLFREAKKAGLAITIHAGEWGGAENVHEALTDLQADRIGHGVRVIEDPATVELARQIGAAFEVCLTSNYQTGVVKDLKVHPFLKMIEAGINVTLNTDDPSISQITLSDEYRLACNGLGLPDTALVERIYAAARAALITAGEKQALVDDLQQEIQSVGSA
jgi:adenosine deaminase